MITALASLSRGAKAAVFFKTIHSEVLLMKTYEHSFTLRVSDCDGNNRWRPGSLLVELQEIAGYHSAAMGFGREALLEKGIVWVLARTALRMDRYPCSGEKLTVTTYHRPARHRLYPRFFLIRDGAGDLIGTASTLWVLMDVETRQGVSPDRLDARFPDNSDLPEPMPLPGSIPALEGETLVLPSHAVYTDLDPNGHVNNTRYVDWLCNILGIETLRDNRIADLTVHYNTEIRPGQEISLRLTRAGSRFHLAGFSGDNPEKASFEIGGCLASVL